MYASKPLINIHYKNIFFSNFNRIQKRWKNKPDHWSMLAKKKFPVDRALGHFDDFYKNVYGNRWSSIRLALLSPHKYCAVVNNFGDAEDVMLELQNIGALNMKILLELEKDHLKEKKQEEKRNRDMENIFRLDKKLEQMMLRKQQEEIETLYPHSENQTDVKVPTDIIASSTKSSDMAYETPFDTESKETRDEIAGKSLQLSLEDAEYDKQRFIDAASGLSAAAVYEYVPATRLKGIDDWVAESQHYNYYKKHTDLPVHVENDYNLTFPEHLKVFTFERGNNSSFPAPRRCSTGVSNYYLLDGGSVLPVLALDLKPGDEVLDMCAAPGGKSLLMMQTLFPAHLVCNDIQESRTNRIHSIFEQYLYNLDKWKNNLFITQRDGRAIDEYNLYNKILVDVPCTTDRHSLHSNENNIFKPTRTKERLQIPEMQSGLLSHALKLVRPGGTVVYSTCSLSPIQNDGVVHMALRKIWEETDIEIVVKDMTAALEPLQNIYRLGEDLGLKYGHLVLPFLPCNFGPMYFCKLVRTK